METVAPIRAVSRTISVLQTINRFGSLSMTAIAKTEALPYPTAYRIVQTLMHEGLIEQEPTRKHYRPTALVQSLAHGYREQGRQIDCAGPVIRALTRAIGWPIFVTERVGPRMVVRDATHSETSLTYGLCYPGFNVPLLTSATGYAWLAQVAEAEVDHAIKWQDISLRAALDARAISELKQRLEDVRDKGFAAKNCLNNETNRSASIALPVFSSGRITLVMTLIYFQQAMKQEVAIERYLQPMQDAVARIEAALEAAHGTRQM